METSCIPALKFLYAIVFIAPLSSNYLSTVDQSDCPKKGPLSKDQEKQRGSCVEIMPANPLLPRCCSRPTNHLYH